MALTVTSADQDMKLAGKKITRFLDKHGAIVTRFLKRHVAYGLKETHVRNTKYFIGIGIDQIVLTNVLRRYIVENGYHRIDIPLKRLYRIPGQGREINDKNYLYVFKQSELETKAIGLKYAKQICKFVMETRYNILGSTLGMSGSFVTIDDPQHCNDRKINSIVEEEQDIYWIALGNFQKLYPSDSKYVSKKPFCNLPLLSLLSNSNFSEKALELITSEIETHEDIRYKILLKTSVEQILALKKFAFEKLEELVVEEHLEYVKDKLSEYYDDILRAKEMHVEAETEAEVEA